MPAPDDSFPPNPFALLDADKYPDRRSASMPEQPDEDSRLFMEAMRKGLPRQKKTRTGGFLLGEICELPKKSQKKPDPPLRQTSPPMPPEEEDEFLIAMRNTRPLAGKGRKIAPRPSPAIAPQGSDPAFGQLLAENPVFSVSSSDEYLEGHVTGLDEAIMNRLRQGQFSPEAHLDLHGLNAAQAFETLRFFMREAWFKGVRCVLLVPGRGRNSPEGQGVLRRKLQSWLTQDPFKRVVLAFCTAQPFDGGPGSIYVLLRKFRKKGRIFWERMPADADLY